MRVLHLTRDYPPRLRGGISTMVGEMVAALGGAGVCSAVISFDAWRPKAAPPDPCENESEPRRSAVFRIAGSADRARLNDAEQFALRFAPDLVEVHHAMLWELGERIGDLTAAVRIKTVHVVHSAAHALRGGGRETFSLRAQRRALVEADLVIAPSQAAAALLIDDHPGVAGRLEVVPPGVADSDAARTAAASRRADATGPAAYLGRFADIKGTADWLSAIELLAADPAATPALVIAGGLPENAKSERRWRERIAATGAPVEVTGWLDGTARDALLARAGLLVVPSRLETFGLVALEGALFGLPVVATRVGAIAEVLTHERTALLCTPGDPGALAEAVSLLHSDATLAADLGERAAEEVRAHWTWESRIAERVSVYERLLAA